MRAPNLFIFLSGILLITCNACITLKKEDHFSTTNGRVKNLFFSFNQNDIIEKFIFSGGSGQTIHTGEWDMGKFKQGWKIAISKGVYYSNEENPDTSKDKPASVIVHFIENKKTVPFFVAKGYKFFFINKPDTKKKPSFIIRHWSGVMGCTLTDFSFFEKKEIKPIIENRNTKTTTQNKIGEPCNK